ncbi:hypothetical protein RCO27_03850 [Sphingosinicella sp. LHD-64]|uniref:hypothetical protein n=1 Tax=Sphingosinicella sp. LHD-64 TaxID=3072139 RepID=UPI00280EBA8D|nr:hypothetical protein [Sphingosinicella sp. LHD-64]MDQ8755354.1 hypothetical protein [Sphingosinicella sp. LHD-64]
MVGPILDAILSILVVGLLVLPVPFAMIAASLLHRRWPTAPIGWLTLGSSFVSALLIVAIGAGLIALFISTDDHGDAGALAAAGVYMLGHIGVAVSLTLGALAAYLWLRRIRSR